MRKEDVLPKERQEEMIEKAKLMMKNGAPIFQRGLYEQDFATLHSYCMFIGYPRSGHTLVGSLLDAHPDIVIAYELDAFSFIQCDVSREELFTLLLEKSKRFKQEGGISAGYSYMIPNQSNGIYRELKVIGDKKGGASSQWLVSKKNLLEKLLKLVELPTKMIHVTRNPFDNISTILHRQRMINSLDDAIDFYFYLCDSVAYAKAQIEPCNWFEMMLEELIYNPKQTVIRLFNFLEVSVSADFLEDCANFIYKSPRKTRYDAPWTTQLIKQVESRMRQYPFLAEYSYDE